MKHLLKLCMFDTVYIFLIYQNLKPPMVTHYNTVQIFNMVNALIIINTVKVLVIVNLVSC